MVQSNMKTVIAISGSTRKNSTNYILIKIIAELAAEKFNIKIYEGLSDLPHFNPDFNENIPKEVTELRDLLNKANGILICTPEYAHGVPGALKNIIDWTVYSGEFYQKPVALITASTDGQYGHRAMLEILRAVGSKNIDHLQLLISFVKTKINMENKITDDKTLTDIKKMIERFSITLNEIPESVH